MKIISDFSSTTAPWRPRQSVFSTYLAPHSLTTPSLVADFEADLAYQGGAATTIEVPFISNTPLGRTVEAADGTIQSVGLGGLPVIQGALMLQGSHSNQIIHSNATTQGWSPMGAKPLTDMALGALTQFGGVKVASNGATWNRAAAAAVTLTAGQSYRVTVWYQLGTSGKRRVELYQASPFTVLSVRGAPMSTTFGASGGTLTELEEIEVQPDIYRLSFTITPSHAITARFGIGPDSAVSNEDVIALGMQIDEAGDQGCYIATTGSALSLPADSVMATPPNAVANAGALFLELTTKKADMFLASLNDGTLTNSIDIATSASDIALTVTSNSVANYNTSVAYGGGDKRKIAFAYDPSGISFAVDGSIIQHAGGINMPILHTISLGQSLIPSLKNYDGRITALSFFPQRISDLDLISMTS